MGRGRYDSGSGGARARDLMDRRGFLGKVALAGAVTVGGGAFTGAGKALGASRPPDYGYRVGDRAADFSGPDQYMRRRKLSDNRGSWVLIDLCPVWCLPCNYSAQWHFAFTNYVRSKGIRFHLQPVVVESLVHVTPDTFGPSSREDAERWAVKYELEREALLHCNGDPNSSLRDLFRRYGQANNTAPGYPTYVLVDPAGVIRMYLAGADLNAIQATLASLTGKTLNQDWTDLNLIPHYSIDPDVGSASFKLWDGTPVSMPGPAGHIENQYAIFDTSGRLDLVSKLDDPVTDTGSGLVRDHSKELDLHSPIVLTLGGVSPVPGTFRSPDQTVEFWEASAIYPPDLVALKGSARSTTTFNPDGTVQMTFTASDFFSDGPSGWVGSTDDDRASNYVSFQWNPANTIHPYKVALDLTAAVDTDPALSARAKSAVKELLAEGREELGKRDYADAARQFGKAQRLLAAAGSSLAGTAGVVKAHVNWLGTRYTA